MDKEYEVRIKLTEDYIGDLDEDKVRNIVQSVIEEIEITGGIFTGVLRGEVLEVKWTNEPSRCAHCGLIGGH